MQSSRRPRLLLIGMGTQGRPYLHRAHEEGIAVSLLDHECTLSLQEVQATFGTDDRAYLVGDDAGLEEWLAAAGAALADSPVDGVVAFSEQHVLPAALVAEELGLPGPGLRAATISRNKFLQRGAWDRAGLPQPGYHLATGPDSACAWAAQSFPVVVKPLDASGSEGVRVVGDESELRAWAATEAGTGPFLCEQYVSGPEYSCELLVQSGRVVFANVTEKLTTPLPYFVEIGHRVPASCPAATTERIIRTATAAAAAIGMRDGIAHVEMRDADGRACLIEMAVRTPGDFIMDVVELATGVDLFRTLITISLGRVPDTEPTVRGAACVWFATPPAGSVAPVDALRTAAGLPGVVRVDVPAEPDSLVAPLRSSIDRVGSVVLRAADGDELDSRLSAVRAVLDDAQPVGGPA